jgi:hypothetical protein
MKQQTKLNKRQETAAEQQSVSKAGREFSSSDELLRFDASQTSVPPEIKRRLQESTSEIQPPASRSWWKNLFGR